MKYSLPRCIFSKEIYPIVAKEVRKQTKTAILRASLKKLKEIAAVSDAIQKYGIPQYLVRKKLPKGIGYGIFLHPMAQPILKGQVIAPYSGEVSLVPQNVLEDSLYAFESLSHILLTKEEQMLLKQKYRYHPRRYYSLQVDALKKGNFTRFINHSETPNISAEFFTIPENSIGLDPAPIEILYLANKTIRPGEQLLINYDGDEHSYWDALDIRPVPMNPSTYTLTPNLRLNCRKIS